MRSKPDPGDQPVNIPLPPDQHHCSDEAKWRMGGWDGTPNDLNTEHKYE